MAKPRKKTLYYNCCYLFFYRKPDGTPKIVFPGAKFTQKEFDDMREEGLPDWALTGRIMDDVYPLFREFKALPEDTFFRGMGGYRYFGKTPKRFDRKLIQDVDVRVLDYSAMWIDQMDKTTLTVPKGAIFTYNGRQDPEIANLHRDSKRFSSTWAKFEDAYLSESGWFFDKEEFPPQDWDLVEQKPYHAVAVDKKRGVLAHYPCDSRADARNVIDFEMWGSMGKVMTREQLIAALKKQGKKS